MSFSAECIDEALKEAIQDGLPLTPEPYRTIADALGISEAEVVARLQQWIDEGFIKRLGLVVRHHHLGYGANAMVVWDVPDAEVDALGEIFRATEGITLCYRRPRRLPHWPYNLFCMIHGQNRTKVLELVARLVEGNGLRHIPREVLFSTRQYKQRGGRYARTTTRAGA